MSRHTVNNSSRAAKLESSKWLKRVTSWTGLFISTIASQSKRNFLHLLAIFFYMLVSSIYIGSDKILHILHNVGPNKLHNKTMFGHSGREIRKPPQVQSVF
jgi:hypothetical protein